MLNEIGDRRGRFPIYRQALERSDGRLAKLDLRDELVGSGVPISIVHGDDEWDLAHADRLCEAKSARRVHLQGAGHFTAAAVIAEGLMTTLLDLAMVRPAHATPSGGGRMNRRLAPVAPAPDQTPQPAARKGENSAESQSISSTTARRSSSRKAATGARRAGSAM